MDRHSSQSSLLNLTSVSFRRGLPGPISGISVPDSVAHFGIAVELNYGLFSDIRIRGTQRALINCAKTSMVSFDRIVPATTMARL